MYQGIGLIVFQKVDKLIIRVSIFHTFNRIWDMEKLKIIYNFSDTTTPAATTPGATTPEATTPEPTTSDPSTGNIIHIKIELGGIILVLNEKRIYVFLIK